MKENEITFKEHYWSNGQLRYKYQYLNGKKHGEQSGYYRNGELCYKEQYLMGEKHGEQLSYHNGELCYKEYYIKGEKVSEEEWIKYNKPEHDTQFLTDLYV